MAVKNFTLYDLIVDIVPGSLAILLFYPVAKKALPIVLVTPVDGILAGGAFLILAYFIGRIIHTLGSILEKRGQTVGEDNKEEEKTDSGTQRIKSLFGYNHYSIERILNPQKDIPCDSRISSRIAKRTKKRLTLHLGVNYDTKPAKHYGQNLLYAESTLYSKYEALSTFFRSTSLVLFSGFTVYLCSNFYLSAGLFFSMLISLYGWGSFLGRRNRAFIYDLCTVLMKD